MIGNNYIKYILLCLYLCISITIAHGCGPGGAGGRGGALPDASRGLRVEGADRAARGRAVTDYRLAGVVKKVERELEHVTIAHEAIPGFMDAMKMRFSYKDRAALDRLEPGDRVEGTLRVEKENGAVIDYQLRDLAVTGRAAPRPMEKGESTGEVQVREQPRRLEIGDLVPDFAMTNQDGKVVKLSDLRGNVVVLTFIYTRCPLPDFCPLMDRKFSELAQHISNFPGRARSVRLISLSFDPDHDTADVLRKHAQIRGASPPLWSYAVASHDELAKIAGPLGLFYGSGKDDIAHNLCTAVIDRSGKLARLEVGTTRNKWETASFLKTIFALITPSES
jgi:protein SCO1/2